MSRRPPKTLKKSIPFFIVEGKTEKNYIENLKNIFNIGVERPKPTKGGNPIGVLKKAKRIIKEKKEYSTFFIWFDLDKIQDKEKFFNLCNQLKKINIEIFFVVSAPCTEAFLLGHFETIRENQLNKECKYFEKKLEEYIPAYKKGNERQINKYITKEKINFCIFNYPVKKFNLFCMLYYFFNTKIPDKRKCDYREIYNLKEIL